MDRQTNSIIPHRSRFLATPRRRYLLAAIISLLSVTAWSGFGERSFAQEDIDFPYQALVSKEKASVRSGPGAVHYATQTLKQATR